MMVPQGGYDDMPRPTGPTVPRFQLGAQLRALREAAGLPHEAIAELLDCSESKIYKFESGDVAVRRPDLLVMLDRYGVADPLRASLLELQKQGTQRGWWARYGQLPSPYSMYVGLESAATLVKNYELAVIPGLLQIEDYTRALLKAQGFVDSGEEIERRVSLRLARQACLTEDPILTLWTILDEGALHRQIGGADVMRAQLDHLVDMSRLPNITVQVLPFSEGGHPGTLGSLAILEFAPDTRSPLAYAETYAGGVYLESVEEIRRATMVYTQMQAAALSATKSVELIAATRKTT